jgi:SAM-dependent methyltransferase
MHFRTSIPLLVVMALGCNRASKDRDSQIGRTTYEGEELRPASRTVDPPPEPATSLSPEPSEAPPSGEEDADFTIPPRGATRNSAPATETDTKRVPDVIYVPTPQPIVDKMLELAQVKKKDVVYDLGCGDGRIVVTAAKRYGARAVGFDIDPARITEAKQNVEKNGVGELVTIENKDIFTLDLSPASVVTLYLLPELNDRLLPQLEKLGPGARVVSHDYAVSALVPARTVEVTPRGDDREHPVFLYTVPFERKRALPIPAPVLAPPSVP